MLLNNTPAAPRTAAQAPGVVDQSVEGQRADPQKADRAYGRQRARPIQRCGLSAQGGASGRGSGAILEASGFPARSCVSADQGAHVCGVSQNAGGAHIVHAVLVGAHSLCCGAPIAMAALGAAAGAGALAGMAGAAAAVHDAIHHHEALVLAVSAALVLIGAVLEWRLWRKGVRRVPWLFALSCAALTANVVIIVSHLSPLADGVDERVEIAHDHAHSPHPHAQ